LYDELTGEQKSKYLEAMDYYAPNVTYQGAATGANKVWQCANMALRGILSQSGEKIRMAVEGLDTEFKIVTAGDGFYEDGSFVQHQWHPYTGGYGRSLLDQLSEMVTMVHGSEWEVPRRHMEMLYGWVRNAYEPLLYRGAMMDMVRGREIARPGTDDRGAGHSILLSLLRLSRSAPGPEKQYLESLVKQHALADHYQDMISIIPLYMVSDYRRLMADPSVEPAPAEARHKQFSMMDRVVHTTPAFGFAVSMSSSRIENYETINEENLKGWYVGDGMTYLYDNDLRQYSDNFWPTVDPYRMAGTTVDTRTREAKTLPLAPGLLYADGYKSPRHWVGGSSIDGKYGICGMWLDAFESTLEAKKTWFMIGDEIVALGAGINSTDNRTIETTVENRKLNAGAPYVLTLDGASVLAENGRYSAPQAGWAHFAGVDERTAVGYYFPEPTALNLLREERTGSWADIDSFGIYKNTDPVTKSFFTLWLDHGRNPVNAAYAYVVLPGKSVEQVREYAAGPNMKVLSNTPQVQAVQATREGVIGLSFWDVPSAPVAGVRVSAPASVILRETATELLIGVSDPSQIYQDEITVELDKNAAGVRVENPDIKALSLAPLKLQVRVKGGLGRTFVVTLRK
jgi:hyaluronate lyase